jgi:hypothetical protein
MATARKKGAAAPERQRIITVGLQPSLIDDIDIIAETERRSRNQQITVWIERGIRDWHAAHQPARKRGAV